MQNMKLLKSLQLYKIFKVTITALVLFLAAPRELHKASPGLFLISDQQCIALAIFHEARGESLKGMQAVAEVIHWRSKSTTYKGSLCKVVFQPKQFSFTHQQNYARLLKVLEGDLSDYSELDYQRYLQAERIALKPFKDLVKVLPDWTMHYHSEKVKPKWLTKKKRVVKIGSHIFYKEKRK